MPAAHPWVSLAGAGPECRERALAELKALLVRHEGDVRATAAALAPPAHETTVHDWIVRFGLRPWLDLYRETGEAPCGLPMAIGYACTRTAGHFGGCSAQLAPQKSTERPKKPKRAP
jgi:hypothetical protein